jgi:hypothetical protein
MHHEAIGSNAAAMRAPPRARAATSARSSCPASRRTANGYDASRREDSRLGVAGEDLEAQQRGGVGAARVAEGLGGGDARRALAIAEQVGEDVERVGAREVRVGEAAQPAQLAGGVLLRPALLLDVAKARDEDPIVPVVEGVEGADDRELAAARRIALHGVVAQALEGRGELGDERFEPVLGDQIGRGGDDEAGRRLHGRAQLALRCGRGDVELAQLGDALLQRALPGRLAWLSSRHRRASGGDAERGGDALDGRQLSGRQVAVGGGGVDQLLDELLALLERERAHQRLGLVPAVEVDHAAALVGVERERGHHGLEEGALVVGHHAVRDEDLRHEQTFGHLGIHLPLIVNDRSAGHRR